MKKPSKSSSKKKAQQALTPEGLDSLEERDEHAELAFYSREELAEAIVKTDKSELSYARTQWYFGDWQDLANLDIKNYSHHPDAGKLAALKAAGYQQLNDIVNCESNIRLARELGCDDRFIARILVAGVHNTLANISALKQDENRMATHYKAALDVGERTADTKHALKARSISEMSRLGLLPQATGVFERQINAFDKTKQLPREQAAQLHLLRRELESLKSSANKKHHDQADEKATRLILVASMPRSGSTWLYNCVKQVLYYQDQDVYCSWVEAYNDENPASIHVVKAHEPIPELAASAQTILTTRRDVREVAASLVRMSWNAEGDEFVAQLQRIVNTVHPFWYSRTKLELEYKLIKKEPEFAVEQVGHSLGIHLAPGRAVDIASALDELEVPIEYDEDTQMHPGHRAEKEEHFEEILGKETSATIQGLFQDWLESFGYI